MDAKDLTAVMLKIAGLIILGYSLFSLPYYFSPEAISSSRFSLGESLLSLISYLALPMLVGLLLWFFPATVTNRIVSGKKLTNGKFGVAELERVALTVLGVWMVAYGAGDVVANLVWIYRVKDELPIVSPRVFAGVVAAIVKITIGLALAIGAPGVMRVIKRFRGRDDG